MLKLTTENIGVIFIDESHPAYALLKDTGNVKVDALVMFSKPEEPKEPEKPKLEVTEKMTEYLLDHDWLKDNTFAAKLLTKHVEHFLSSEADTTRRKSIRVGKTTYAMHERDGLHLLLEVAKRG